MLLLPALFALCFVSHVPAMVVIPGDADLFVQAPPRMETVSEKKGDGKLYAPCSRHDVKVAVSVIRESQDFTCESAFVQVTFRPVPVYAAHAPATRLCAVVI